MIYMFTKNLVWINKTFGENGQYIVLYTSVKYKSNPSKLNKIVFLILYITTVMYISRTEWIFTNYVTNNVKQM